MRVGLALPQFDFSVPGERPLAWGTVAVWARRAEDLGFSSLWLADHLFLDLSRYGGPAEPSGAFDPIPALAALARVTHRARIGSLVLCGPLRPPSVLAKALATLDVISGGRLTVGIGAGWYEPEFAAAGVRFERPAVRLGQLAEAIVILRGLFGGGPFTFAGRHWSVENALCLPLPVQRPHPPIWVGGRGDALLRLAARHADGWNTVWVWTPDEYRQRSRFLDAACEGAGRDPAAVTRSLGLFTLVGEDEADLRRRFERLCRLSPPGVLEGTSLADWRRGRLVGTVEQVGEQLEGWAELGVDDLIVGAGVVPFAVAHPDDLEMIAAACSLYAPCPTSDPRN
ncbi:MAG: LLM class flavin-dependent oxidoreductase [Acidimicrobiales bacterium]